MPPHFLPRPRGRLIRAASTPVSEISPSPSAAVPRHLRENLAAIEARIAAACSRAGRPRESVTLIGVSKTFPPSLIDAAVALGVRDIGENRVQELRDKAGQVSAEPRWHLIGHIQSNKAKDAARVADVVHTVDSLKIAERLSSEATRLGKTLDVLIQVNVGGEEQKSGVAPGGAAELADAVGRCESLRLRGLMTIPPVAPPEESRRSFAALRELRDRLAGRSGSGIFSELSMGMSDDFEVAIEEGATMIRIGRALFGERH